MTMTPPLPPELALAGGAEPLPEEALAQLDAEEGATDAALAEVVQTWRVDDDRLAEWAARKLTAVEREWSTIEEQAEGWVDEITRWRAERLRPLEARRRFFEGALTDYLRRRREEDPTVKTITLPSATLKSSARKAQAVVVDEAAVIAWALAALEADDLATLVDQSPRLMGIRPLRKLADVMAQVVARDVELTLECGHTHELRLSTLLDGEEADGPHSGQEFACDECEPDFDGAPAMKVIEKVEWLGDVEELVARDADTGQPIPGTGVDPETVTFSVSLR